jgi:inhibitor of cysteine peptidase
MYRRIVGMLACALITGVAMGVLAGCGSSGGAATQLTEKDSGKTLILKVGDTLDVTLDANATTGFQWEMSEGDATVVKLLGEPVYAPTPTSTQILGSGGQTTFHFEASKAGTTTVKLIYHRTFEKDVPPEKTFTVEVTVK